MRLQDSYNRAHFQAFLKTFLPDYQSDVRPVNLPVNSLIEHMSQLGASEDCGVVVFEAAVEEGKSARRIAVTQSAFRILREIQADCALIAFHHGDTWRLSLLRTGYEIQDGKVVSTTTNPRRFSYFLGPMAKINTPHKFLIDKGMVYDVDELQNRFSVEVVNKEFYNAISGLFHRLVGTSQGDQAVNGEMHYANNNFRAAQEFAVRLIGRVVFCWFLKEKKSAGGLPLVPEDILSLESVRLRPNYYHMVLEPLFFELLNKKMDDRRADYKTDAWTHIPYLNGGLFDNQRDDYYGEPERVHIPDQWLEDLFSLFGTYNFTVDENTSYDADLSIDPEMLGRIFENLLAEIDPNTGDSARKSTGSFYTPREIVDFMVDSVLLEHLERKTDIARDKLTSLISYNQSDSEELCLTGEERRRVFQALKTITILDPACGSGAFPIGMLQKIVYIFRSVDDDAKLWRDDQLSGLDWGLQEIIREKLDAENLDYVRKLSVISKSIYGVDIQTIATEIAKLRCFLSLIIEENVDDSAENRGIHPLPNLEFKFMSANSLVPLEDVLGGLMPTEVGEKMKKLEHVRERYFQANAQQRQSLKYEFTSLQQDILLFLHQTGFALGGRAGQLSTWKPFESSSAGWFDPAWMFGKEHFSVVIANPPYIHLERMKEQSAQYKAQGFETYEARGDIYALFYEKGVELLRPQGILCYITSNKWMRAAYGKSLRSFFAKHTAPRLLIDFAGQQLFDATVDTNILLLTKEPYAQPTRCVIVKESTALSNLHDYEQKHGSDMRFPVDESWVILSEIEQSIKRKIEAVGTPLRDWDVKINYGIKTGCNEAFIINEQKREQILAACADEDERQRTAELIRPILRGRDVRRYGYGGRGCM